MATKRPRSGVNPTLSAATCGHLHGKNIKETKSRDPMAILIPRPPRVFLLETETPITVNINMAKWSGPTFMFFEQVERNFFRAGSFLFFYKLTPVHGCLMASILFGLKKPNRKYQTQVVVSSSRGMY